MGCFSSKEVSQRRYQPLHGRDCEHCQRTSKVLFHRTQGTTVPPQVEPKTEEERTEQVSQLVTLMYISCASCQKSNPQTCCR